MSKRRTRLSPVEDATGHVISQKDKPWFEERLINAYKGRGVFALMHIESGCFVLEYKGKLISQKESFKRQRRYTEKQNGFLFDFEWNGSSWCIDASEEDGTLGRLVNDDAKNANCKMKKIVVNGRPHLCLFAIKNILPGEEITYDYGDSAWPWRSLVKVNISKKDMLQKKRFGEPEPSLASERLEQINTISQNVSSDMQEDKMTRSPGEPEPSLPSDGCTPVPPAEWFYNS
ncbi:histone-lysine N-methyltransferase set-1-like [Brachyhypopomus gauderio]|uniref:histone-lysine N-methyltransferase set-1-like n=1 Tax=Brachyhypopomus gauderio TaxID=698409 RepID=UPI004041E243